MTQLSDRKFVTAVSCLMIVAAAASAGAATVPGPTSVVTYNWRPSTQLPHFSAAMAAAAAAMPGATVRIVTFGDSTTEGINADDNGGAGALNHSYPADLLTDLGQIAGLATQNANFQGEDIDNGALAFAGPGFTAATAYSGLGLAGGNAITTTAKGQSVTFTLAQTGAFDTLNVNYFDAGSGSVTVTALGGPAGPVIRTLLFGATGTMRTQAIHLPAGIYTGAIISAAAASTTYLEGASFANSKQPSIQLLNLGIGGAYSSVVGNGVRSGPGEFPGGLAFSPSLALLDYGINDIVNNLYTPAQTVANFRLMVVETRAAKCDPIIVIPNPFGLNPYLPPPQITTLAAVRAGLLALSAQYNVPIIDLSATYGDSPQTLTADNLLNSPHPKAALYADMAARIAALLTGAETTSFPVTAAYSVPGAQSVGGMAGHDILFGSAATNTLTGNGGADTYVMRALDQMDIIINGSAHTIVGLGQLDVTLATHAQIWLTRSGADLVVGVLGTTQQSVVRGWFSSAAAQLQYIVGNDGYQLSHGLPGLLQAMATFQAANPGFNPRTTTYTTTADSYYGSALMAESARDWFK